MWDLSKEKKYSDDFLDVSETNVEFKKVNIHWDSTSCRLEGVLRYSTWFSTLYTQLKHFYDTKMYSTTVISISPFTL